MNASSYEMGGRPQATACATFMMVAKLGLPSPDSDVYGRTKRGPSRLGTLSGKHATPLLGELRRPITPVDILVEIRRRIQRTPATVDTGMRPGHEVNPFTGNERCRTGHIGHLAKGMNR